MANPKPKEQVDRTFHQLWSADGGGLTHPCPPDKEALLAGDWSPPWWVRDREALTVELACI